MKFQQLFGNQNFYIVDNSGGLEDPDRKGNFQQIEKAIRAFVDSPPTSPIARDWFANQQQNRVNSDK